MRAYYRVLADSRPDPRTLFVQMGNVEHDAEFVAPLDQGLAGIGQTGSLIGRTREAERDAVAEEVGA